MMKKEIKFVGDIKGLWVCYVGMVFKDMLIVFGVVLFLILLVEMVDFMFKGIVDGVMFFYEVIKLFNIGLVVKYLFEFGFVFVIFVFVMNKVVFDGLSKEDQKFIDEMIGLECVVEFGKFLDVSEVDGCQYMIDSKVVIIMLSDEQLVLFRKVVEFIVNKVVFMVDVLGKFGSVFFVVYMK